MSDECDMCICGKCGNSYCKIKCDLECLESEEMCNTWRVMCPAVGCVSNDEYVSEMEYIDRTGFGHDGSRNHTKLR